MLMFRSVLHIQLWHIVVKVIHINFLPVSHLIQLTGHCLLLVCLSEIIDMLVKVLKDNHGPFHITKAHKTALVLNWKIP